MRERRGGTVITDIVLDLSRFEPPAVEARNLLYELARTFESLRRDIAPVNVALRVNGETLETDVRARLAQLTRQLQQATAAYRELPGPIRNVVSSLKLQTDELTATIKPMKDLAAIPPGMSEAWRTFATALQTTTARLQVLEYSFTKPLSAARALKRSAKELGDEFKDLYRIADSLRESFTELRLIQRAGKDALKVLSDTAQDAGVSYQQLTEATRAAGKTILDMKNKALEPLGQSLVKTAGQVETLGREREAIERLRDAVSRAAQRGDKDLSALARDFERTADWVESLGEKFRPLANNMRLWAETSKQVKRPQEAISALSRELSRRSETLSKRYEQVRTRLASLHAEYERRIPLQRYLTLMERLSSTTVKDARDLSRLRQQVYSFSTDVKRSVRVMNSLAEASRTSGAGMGGFGDAVKGSEETIARATRAMSGFFKSFSRLDAIMSKVLIRFGIWGTIRFVIADIARSFERLVSIAEEAARVTDVRAALAALSGSVERYTAVVSKAQAAAGGLVDQQTLLRLTSRAFITELPVERFHELISVARRLAVALGIDVREAVERLTMGIAKQETEILDELGLYVRLNEALRKYAERLGKSTDELTVSERTTAYFNAVMEQAWKRVTELGLTLGENTRPFALMRSATRELGLAMGEFIRQGLSATSVVERLTSLARTLTEAIRGKGAALLRTTAEVQEQLTTYLRMRETLEQAIETYRKFTEGLRPEAIRQAAKENSELAEALRIIQRTVPGAVTAVDDYGTALDINVERVREFLRMQRQVIALRQFPLALKAYSEATESLAKVGFESAIFASEEFQAALKLVYQEAREAAKGGKLLEVTTFSETAAFRGLSKELREAVMECMRLSWTTKGLGMTFIDLERFIEAGYKMIRDTNEELSRTRAAANVAALTLATLIDVFELREPLKVFRDAYHEAMVREPGEGSAEFIALLRKLLAEQNFFSIESVKALSIPIESWILLSKATSRAERLMRTTEVTSRKAAETQRQTWRGVQEAVRKAELDLKEKYLRMGRLPEEQAKLEREILKMRIARYRSFLQTLSESHKDYQEVRGRVISDEIRLLELVSKAETASAKEYVRSVKDRVVSLTRYGELNEKIYNDIIRILKDSIGEFRRRFPEAEEQLRGLTSLLQKYESDLDKYIRTSTKKQLKETADTWRSTLDAESKLLSKFADLTREEAERIADALQAENLLSPEELETLRAFFKSLGQTERITAELIARHLIDKGRKMRSAFVAEFEKLPQGVRPPLREVIGEFDDFLTDMRTKLADAVSDALKEHRRFRERILSIDKQISEAITYVELRRIGRRLEERKREGAVILKRNKEIAGLVGQVEERLNQRMLESARERIREIERTEFRSRTLRLRSEIAAINQREERLKGELNAFLKNKRIEPAITQMVEAAKTKVSERAARARERVLLSYDRRMRLAILRQARRTAETTAEIERLIAETTFEELRDRVNEYYDLKRELGRADEEGREQELKRLTQLEEDALYQISLNAMRETQRRAYAEEQFRLSVLRAGFAKEFELDRLAAKERLDARMIELKELQAIWRQQGLSRLEIERRTNERLKAMNLEFINVMIEAYHDMIVQIAGYFDFLPERWQGAMDAMLRSFEEIKTAVQATIVAAVEPTPVTIAAAGLAWTQAIGNIVERIRAYFEQRREWIIEWGREAGARFAEIFEAGWRDRIDARRMINELVKEFMKVKLAEAVAEIFAALFEPILKPLREAVEDYKEALGTRWWWFDPEPLERMRRATDEHMPKIAEAMRQAERELRLVMPEVERLSGQFADLSYTFEQRFPTALAETETGINRLTGAVEALRPASERLAQYERARQRELSRIAVNTERTARNTGLIAEKEWVLPAPPLQRETKQVIIIEQRPGETVEETLERARAEAARAKGYPV